jgi:hypothetical protein
MSIEYIAAIAEKDYEAFKSIVSTTLPDDYEMWLRVRDRGSLRALKERAVVLTEVKVSPDEFRAYGEGLRNPDFSIAALDGCAREKALANQFSKPAAEIRHASTLHEADRQ